ncbi:alpha/beta fold hydrolase [Leucobacter sp. CSA1]|uniref:Alpha/beta fold hydrolase n=1 Tax=Leucobacter chromiisoli TaxID=2796471 RepID=A0A934UTT1_9MICO|nr:alpha/beta fold hydrolase [Leucobacter chromiisoli]MBK0417483.1 alpha/beta fold hydrolase [Leucobacter chromiisoli]
MSDTAPVGFTYVDAQGVEISVYEWAAEEPVGIVQIAHGIGEHAGRYAAFAQDLVRAGFAVYADDHRGHGETGRRQWGGDLARLGRLGPGGLRATEAAILQLTGLIRDRHPGVPVIMFGHSWGSLMAQRLLNRHPRAWDAVVLSGSAHRSPAGMESGKLNAGWAGPEANGFEWLSRDPSVAERFIADPLCFEADILKLLGPADALRLFGTPAAGLAPDIPIHIVAGSADPLSKRDSLRRLADAYRRRGVRDVTLKVYPEARHELLNELGRDEVVADLVTWMLDRVGA